MVTPLRGRDELDVAGLERLVEHILAGGVNGLFILGTTGEGPSLSYRLRRELVERVCRQVKNRVPVLVGITDTAFIESVNLARHSAEVGASAVVVAPPSEVVVSPETVVSGTALGARVVVVTMTGASVEPGPVGTEVLGSGDELGRPYTNCRRSSE